jgi:nickel-dependent lactate racemase
LKIKLPWDEKNFLEFETPENWKILLEGKPEYFPEIVNIEDEIKKTLENPVNSPSLKEICKNKSKISIVVEDISRPSPTEKILPEVIKEIEKAGVNLENVIIIPALGAHREMREEEMKKKCSEEVLKKVKWRNHKYKDKNEVKYLGRTKRGTPVYVNKYVADSDLVILVGTIEPHPQAGFGGGYKNILPGVAGVRTIFKNHLLSAHPQDFLRVGWKPEKNPMREDLEEAGKMLKGEVFLINCVLNSDLKIVKILTGCPIAAHREGIKISEKIYKIKIPKQADLVITNSYPLDLDLRQSVKCLANSLFAVKKDGILIATMRCREGIGNFSIPNLNFIKNYNLLRIISKILIPLVKNINIPGISLENRFSIYFALKAILRNKIYIYSPEIAKNLKGIPLFCNFEKFQDLIDFINKSLPGERDVLIFPYGGVTYPEF